jgi:GTPase Era involved in 16S rRNA processing
MVISSNSLLDLFELLMHKLGVRLIVDEKIQERPKDELKLDLLLQEKIFRKEKPQIGLIGKIKAGKSTLGNAMFGQEAFNAGETVVLVEKLSLTTSPFETGTDLEVTEKVSRKILPSGIVIWDSPGFAGFSGYEEQTRALMSQCDLLLYIIRYPGAMDTTALSLYETEIKPFTEKPFKKSVITVINVEEGIPQGKAEQAITKFRTKANLPNVVYAYALSGNHVDSLLVKMIDYLPKQYTTTFSDALDTRYQRDTRNYIAYHLSVNAAAAAACTSVVEDFTDKPSRTKLNKIVLLSAGLPLKIASVYESDFNISEPVKQITRELANNRFTNVITEVKTGPLTALGAVVGAVLTAGVTQSPLVAALLATVGLAATPLGIAIVAALTAATGAILANNISKSLEVMKQPGRGGFDIAVAVLAHGYTTLATILAQKDGTLTPQQSVKFYGETFQRHYDRIIRDAFDASLKWALENATEGDRVKMTHLLLENKDLRKIFANMDQNSEAVHDFGVTF